MATTTLPYRYLINGLIDTNNTVMENLELITNTCASWITYDAMEGKWGVVINQADIAQYSFNDNNIIGAINLSGTGLTDYYNAVEVRFPHRDILDEQDLIRIDLPSEERLPNEPDNVLTMDYAIVNEPVHAQTLGYIELRQSRLDKVIEFQVDYSRINMNAGDIVNVTSSVYGWTNKKFRIVRMEEQDQDATIVISVTALEYATSTYDLSQLYRFVRTNEDGIVTLGLIGRPATPTVEKFESDVRPRIVVSSGVPDGADPTNPAGLVETFEFWYYEVFGDELTDWAELDDTTRQYTLLGTLKPAASNVYVPGTELSLDVDQLSTGSYLFKVRGVNSKTAGPYSLRTNLIAFQNTQTTRAVSEQTIITENGAVVNTDLPLSTLTTSLDGYLEGTTNMTAKSYERYNDSYLEENGVAIDEWLMLCNGYGEQSITGIGQSLTLSDFLPLYDTGPVYILRSGFHVATFNIATKFSGAIGGRGDYAPYWTEPTDYIQFRLNVYEVGSGNLIAQDYIGALGQGPNTGFTITQNLVLDNTKQYQFIIDLVHFTQAQPTVPASFEVSILLFTILGAE